MTREEAKRELAPLKTLDSEIRAVELEIERLMTAATKMTTNYDPINVSHTPKNKLEEVIIKMDEYKSNLSKYLFKYLEHKNECLNKVQKIEISTLRTILIYYYFQNKTLEQTAEAIGKSYQWTYELFQDALDAYCEISEKNQFT